MNIERAIRRAGQYANKVTPYLNHGGCGVFALALCETLRSYGVRAHVYCFGSSYKTPARNSCAKLLREGNLTNRSAIREEGWDRHHLRVRWGEQDWDSDGNEWEDRRRIRRALPLYALRAWNAEPSLWNPLYDRRKNAAVKAAVKRAFKEELQLWEDEQLLRQLAA